MAKSYWRSSNYLEWLLDRQDVMMHRVHDLKILGSEEEYQKLMLFFTDVHNHYLTYFPDGYGYSYRPQDVLECEFILLEAMDCSLIVFHPYRPLVQFCEELRPELHECADLLLERAWWLVNDSFRTDVCLHYPPYIIALGCLQLAAVIVTHNSDLVNSISGSSALPGSSTKHSYVTHQPQPSINALAVLDRWFGELNVDMEKVLEVTRHMLSLYELWRRFDEATEMPNLLLKKIPRPSVQPPHSTQSFAAANSTNVTSCSSTASQSSASLSGGTQAQHAPMVVSSSGGGGAAAAGAGSGGGGTTGTSGSIHAMPEHQQQQQQSQQQHYTSQQQQQPQQQRGMGPTNQNRIHQQGMQHMGVR